MKIKLLICIFCLFVMEIDAQRASERGSIFSLGAGSVCLLGDFPSKRASEASLKQNVALGAQLSKYVTEGISCGANLYYYLSSATSDVSSRNYQFQSKMVAMSCFGAIDPISFIERENKRFDFVVSFNLGVIHAHVPFMAFPVGSEHPDGADRLKSDCWGKLLGAGVGWRYNLNFRVGIRMELNYNIASTDFLDGYSPRDSKSNDVYLHGIIAVFIRLPSDREWNAR